MYKKLESGWKPNLKKTGNLSESALRVLNQTKHIINPETQIQLTQLYKNMHRFHEHLKHGCKTSRWDLHITKSARKSHFHFASGWRLANGVKPRALTSPNDWQEEGGTVQDQDRFQKLWCYCHLRFSSGNTAPMRKGLHKNPGRTGSLCPPHCPRQPGQKDQRSPEVPARWFVLWSYDGLNSCVFIQFF